MKLKGLKKAVGRYNRGNGGHYSAYYANLMYAPSEGLVWTDEFCDFSRGSYVHYDDPTIVCISNLMKMENIPVTMKTVKEFIEKNFSGEV